MKSEKQNEKWDAQLRKGSLELVILALLKGRLLYGLEILKSLHQFETMKITEGTLYPLLDRLKREDLIAAKWVQEGESRPRKYYQLTAKGEDQLSVISQRWRTTVNDIEHLLNHPGPQPLETQGE